MCEQHCSCLVQHVEGMQQCVVCPGVGLLNAESAHFNDVAGDIDAAACECVCLGNRCEVQPPASEVIEISAALACWCCCSCALTRRHFASRWL